MRKLTIFSIILTVSVVQSAVVIQKTPDLNFKFGYEDSEMDVKKKPTPERYQKMREVFLNEQLSRGLGHDIVLSEKEERVNKIIMAAKKHELDIGFKTPHNFIPSRHIFEVLDEIKTSTLFRIIQKMPKGAVLHAHDTALCNTDSIVKMTYRENLWQCGELTESNRPLYKFSKNRPPSADGCQWTLVEDERKKLGSAIYDSRLRKLLTLFKEDPAVAYKDINDVWSQFMFIFSTLDPIVTYVPVWKEYFYNALKQFREDGVSYLEFRGLLPSLYDLEGNHYTPVQMVQIYIDILTEFKKEYPDFIGCKFIYAPIRYVDDKTIDNYMEIIKSLHKKFPDFIAGFDLVGQEDLGRPLTDYVDRLLQLPDEINFYFHAGETNWNGQTSDENLIDAVLLGTKRIGHGFAIVKNPKVLEEVKAKNICIEVNPVSNQVLKLVDDYRNHPASIYFSDSYPVVVSSDDPSFWEATPLSHDFYQAFLGIASAHQDLRLLKKLAINSLTYSAMSSEELRVAKIKWGTAWNNFIDTVLSEADNNNSI